MWFALTLGDVSVSSYCGTSSIGFDHLKSHSVGQDVQRKGLYDVLQGEQHSHCHSLPRNLDRYSYPSLARHSQRLGIQGFDNPAALLALDPPSNLGVTHPCRELGLPYQLQQTWQSLQGLVAVLWAYLSKRQQSWLASLASKEYLLKSVYPYGLLKSLPLLRGAKRGYPSYSLKLNQVVFSYPIIPQTRVGCKP